MPGPIQQEANVVQGMSTGLAPINSRMGPDEAAAALAFATNIAQGMGGLPAPDKPQETPQAPAEAQNAPTQQVEPQQPPTDIKGEMDKLRADLTQEIQSVKELISNMPMDDKTAKLKKIEEELKNIIGDGKPE